MSRWKLCCVRLKLPLFRRSRAGSLRRLEYAVSGLTLASDIYGAGASQVAEWKDNVEHEKNIFI